MPSVPKKYYILQYAITATYELVLSAVIFVRVYQIGTEDSVNSMR